MSTKEDDIKYLKGLAETLRHVPMMYGTDDGDISRVQCIAARLEGRLGYTDSCPTCETGEHVEERGESGEFWWYCHGCDKDFDKVDRISAEDIANVVEHDVVVSITEPVVHILFGGVAYCRFEGEKMPGHWPSGHTWAWPHDYEHATCDECRARFLDKAILCSSCADVLVDGQGRIMKSARANAKLGPHCGEECRRRLCKHCVDERAQPGQVFCGAACSQEYEMENN